MNPPLILLVGPTAVGKTEFSLQLAGELNGEIVSADSRLFYCGMDIGTAKPSREERARIPHHLIDIAPPGDTLSLAEFQSKARQAIQDIHARRRLPFLVGGTGQYIRAVTEGWAPPEVQPDNRLRLVLEAIKEARGAGWLHNGLQKLDPESAEKIDARNYRRTIRALEVIFSTGQKFSHQRRQAVTPYHVIFLGLIRPRAELYQRVDDRIDLMFASGLMDEVKGLLKNGITPDLPSMSAIGYRECMRVLQGELSIEQARAEMKRLTRIFVRRQANWFKENDPNIRWFNPDHTDTLTGMKEYIRNSLAGLGL